MARESEHVSSSQSLSVDVDLPRRPTTALTNQIRDIDKKTNTERSRNLDSATTVAGVMMYRKHVTLKIFIKKLPLLHPTRAQDVNRVGIMKRFSKI